ncbi:hypothetical protein [Bacteroides eggerthii]|mgnify:CR=1 FL=1|uniref:hypothetical protein n=1 Tax=Bacteroides eggerthii TaxID=28111 RepID=UPI0022E94FAC|nr:hypothetical protein [Bacteroides eggerthii]
MEKLEKIKSYKWLIPICVCSIGIWQTMLYYQKYGIDMTSNFNIEDYFAIGFKYLISPLAIFILCFIGGWLIENVINLLFRKKCNPYKLARYSICISLLFWSASLLYLIFFSGGNICVSSMCLKSDNISLGILPYILMLFLKLDNGDKNEQKYKKAWSVLVFLVILFLFVYVASESLQTKTDIEFQNGTTVVSTKGNELLFIGETKEYIFIFDKVSSKPTVYNKSQITYWSYSKRLP